MNSFVLYGPRRRWTTWLAFVCAATIHLAAVGLARNRADVIASDVASTGDVTGIETVVEAMPPQEEDTTPVVAPSSKEETFPQENMTPLQRQRSAAPIARSAAAGLPRVSSIKALVLYGPRPDYPYAARRDRITGSGLVLATVNVASGSVLDVRMAQSTGSVILDNSTVSTVRRWRFRPGTLSQVQVPITYTLSGASY